MSRVVLYRREPGHRRGGAPFGRPREEFCADFELLARRYLDAWHWRLFRLHFVRGLEWRECAARLGVDRGNFFHGVYRVEMALGRIFAEVRPYGLFPVDAYFRVEGRQEMELLYRTRGPSGPHYHRAKANGAWLPVGGPQ
jgi:hypothetical protein